MPPQQGWRFKLAHSNAPRFEFTLVPDAGHFAATDNPNYVAEKIIDFVSDVAGISSMPSVFMGYGSTLLKGDEAHLIASMNQTLGLKGGRADGD